MKNTYYYDYIHMYSVVTYSVTASVLATFCIIKL